MYCLNCGQPLPDGIEFCTRCGARVGSANAPVPAAKPRSKGPIIAIIVSLVVIAASAGILAFVLMGGNQGTASSSMARSSAVEASSSEVASSADGASSENANGSTSDSKPATADSGAAEESAPSETGANSFDESEDSADQAEPEQPPAGMQPGVDAPFWGVWIGGFKNVDGAEEMVADAQSAGLPAMIFETTDWSNLNSEHYYVVSIGASTDEATANQLCEQAKEAGFDGAYVKYSGERR